MNLITEKTKKEDVLKDYENYPSTLSEGYDAYPYRHSRFEPLYFEIKKGSRVLDLGCNDGEFMRLLKEKNTCDVVGVDLAISLLDICRKKGLNVIKADAAHLPFADHIFDYVCVMELLNHLYDPKKVLKEIRRVLKRDGVLLGSVPHENLERYIWEDKRLHRRYYNEDSLKKELRDVFPITHLRVLNGGQFAISMASSFLLDKPVEMLFKSGGVKTLGWDEALLDRNILRVWMAPTQQPGDIYYRMTGYADKMRTQGAEIGYEDIDYSNPNTTVSWQRLIMRNHECPNRPVSGVALHQLEQVIKASDMSIWQIVGSKDVLAVMRALKFVHKKIMITEVDDWLFDIPSYNVASNPYKPNSEFEWIALKQLELSDEIIVSTQFIKDGLMKMFPEKRIHVMRNAIDFELWDNVKGCDPKFGNKKEGVVRIGYTGCGNHSGDIEIVKEPLLALLGEFPNLEFILPLGFESWSDVKHERVIVANQWVSIKDYPSMIKGWDLDIGIAPLRDNNFNRAKSNLRWLEYSALKIPTAASPIYPFKNSIKNGENGFLCNNSESWYEVLRDLISDKGKRTSIGQMAYDHVKKEFNLDLVAKEYLDLLNKIKNERNPIISGDRTASIRSR